MQHLRIQILGNLEFLRNDQPVNLKSQKAMGLFIYLAVSQRAHSRAALAALLWGTLPDERARVNLRKALSELRHQVADYLLIAHKTAAFHLASPHTIDLHQLEQAVEQLQLMTHWNEQTEQLDTFLATLPTTLLDGFSVRNAPSFNDWVRRQQLHVHEQMLEGYQQLARLADGVQRADRTIYYLRQILQLQPWQETVHRRLMESLWQHGDRAAALMHFKTCEGVLLEELGVAPEAETVQLYERILAGAWPDPAPDEGKTAVSVPSIVAREEELERLQTLLLANRSGPQLAFVVGEAGSGKSALMDAFVRETARLAVLRSRCNAFFGSGDAYLPFRDMLAGLFLPNHLPDHINLFDIFLQHGPQLINTLLPADRLLNWSAQRWSENRRLQMVNEIQLAEATAKNQAPALEQGLLFAQLTAVMGAVGAEVPLLLLIDDMQWLDAGSVDLLFHLCRELPSQPIKLLGAYRPEDVAASHPHPLMPVLHELRRQFGDVVVNLDAVAKRPFVDAYLDLMPNELDESFRQTLLTQTSGHPLFTVELVRALQEQGSLRQDAAGVWHAQKGLAWHQIPPRVEGVIGERVGRLAHELQQLLRVAAVAGEQFSAEVVAHALGQNAQAVLLALSQTLGKQHQLVVAEGMARTANGRLSRYRFRHILIQKYLYEQLDSIEQAHWHELIAVAIEQLHDEPDGLALSLARHFQRAKLLEPAIRYLHKAAVQAVHRFAHQAAVLLIDEAIGLLDGLENGRLRDLLELDLQILLGPIQATTVGFSSQVAYRTYQRADELNQRIPNGPNQFNILSGLWLYFVVKGDVKQAQRQAELLYESSNADGGPKEQIAAHYAMVGSHFFDGEFEKTNAYAVLADKIYQEEYHPELFQRFGADPGLASSCYRSFSLIFLGYQEQGLQHANKVVALNKKIGNPFNLSYALSHIGLVHHLRYEIEEAVKYSEEALAITREHGFVQWHAQSLIVSGWGYVQTNRVQEGLARIQEGVFILRNKMGSEVAMTHYLWVLADALFALRESDQALTVLDEAIALENRGGRFWLSPALETKGRWLRAVGAASQDVEPWFARAVSIAKEQKAKLMELRAATSWAEIFLEQNQPVQATDLLGPLVNWFTEGHETADLQQANRLLAQAKAHPSLRRNLR